MKKNYLIAFASLALALVGCVKNQIENPQPAGIKYLEVSTPATKTTLDEDGLTLLWKNGDKIKVNNHNSIGLQAEKNKGTSAEFGFTAAEQPEAPYYAVYNATRAYGYGEQGGPHTYKLSLDYNNYTQKWYENSFDPEYSVLYGTSETDDLVFNHAMSYIKITPTLGEENVNIARIDVIAKNGEVVSGRLIVDTVTGDLTPYRDNKSYVTMAGPAEGVALGKSFLIAIPPQEYAGGLKIRIVDVDGNMMEKSTKAIITERGKVYSKSVVYAHTAVAPALATAAEVSSSTACFTWTLGKGAATDVAQAWTIELAKDAAFKNKVVSRNITASNGCWKSIQPKFCFGGLEQDTEYFFRACITGQEDNWSDVVSATTTTFDLTVVKENAQAGDVILAEDFHDSCEGGESVAKAAGFGTKQNALKTYTDAGATMSSETEWNKYSSTSFANWGWAHVNGTATFYPNQGHVKLGTGGYNSQIVTPVLSAISAYADIEVEVTAAVYPDNADRANVKEFFIAPVKGDLSDAHGLTLTTVALPGRAVVPMTDNTKWVTYKATLKNVSGSDHLVIGSNYDIGNTRLLVSDVKVTVKAVSSIEEFASTATEVSSSTVSFTWGYPSATAAEDANRNYEFGLYKDADCTELVVSYKTSAQADDKGCWKQRKPKFCFGGLEPATTYYFKVKDADANVESTVVATATTAFTVVTMPTSAAAAGDIILAEDFSEIIYGGEAVISSASAALADSNDAIYTPLTGANPTCIFKQDSNERSIINTATSSTRLANWCYDQVGGSANIYAHVGSIKLGTGSYKSYAMTPELSAIPEGKTATVEVTVTLSCYSGATAKAIVAAVSGTANNSRVIISDWTKVNKCSDITTFVGAWKTYTVTLDNVTRDQRIAIGPATGNANNKSRMMINDVVVKIKALK